MKSKQSNADRQWIEVDGGPGAVRVTRNGWYQVLGIGQDGEACVAASYRSGFTAATEHARSMNPTWREWLRLKNTRNSSHE